jgi:ribonuclease-3
MRNFLTLVKSTSSEILLVSPFIKLSLIKPFLLALPNTNISLTVITRFTKTNFHFSSDLPAIELLRRRPGAPGPTRIFSLNNLHAKLYIFDRKIVYLGSSNLSFTGFEKNFEMGLRLEDQKLAESCYRQLDNRKVMTKEIAEVDIADMHSRLRTTPVPIELPIGLEEIFEPDDEDLEDSLTSDEPDLEEAGSTLPQAPDAAERLEAIQSIVFAHSQPELNSLAGSAFESPTFKLADFSDDPEKHREEKDAWHATARKDFERLRTVLVPMIGMNLPSVDPQAAVTPFVHEGWSGRFPSVQPYGLGQQRFLSLGKNVLAFELALHFSGQIVLEPETAARIHLATQKLLIDLEYESFLASRGLRVLLHYSDLPGRTAHAQLWSIIGLQFFYLTYDRVKGYLRQFLNERLTGESIQDAILDPKSLLQNIASIDHLFPKYYTERAGGPDENPVFHSSVVIGPRKVGEGGGGNKKESEMKAAKMALDTLRREPRYSLHFEKVLAPGARQLRSQYKLLPKRRREVEALASHLGFLFKRSPAILDIALTHVSYLDWHPEARSYLHLAFIGSCLQECLVLREFILEKGWVITPELSTEWNRWDQAASIVLPEVFSALGLNAYLRTKEAVVTELHSVRSNVVQALLAVAFFWGGMAGASTFWKKWIGNLVPRMASKQETFDPVSTLQAWFQKRGLDPPRYEDRRDPKSPDHAPTYISSCFIDNRKLGEGVGKGKKAAKKEAARQALQKLEEEQQASGEGEKKI